MEPPIAIDDRVRITNGDYSGRTGTVEARYEDPLSGEIIEVWVDQTMIGQDVHEAFLTTFYPSEVERV